MILFSRIFGVDKPVESVDNYERLKTLDGYCKKYGCFKCPVFRNDNGEWNCEKQDILENLNKKDINKVIDNAKNI